MNKVLLFIVVFFSCNCNIIAQCCSAGNPTASDVNYSLTKKKTLKAEVLYRHSESGRFYKTDSPIDMNFMGDAFSNYSEFSLAYGLINRLEIRGNLGYFYNKTEKYNFADLPDSKGFGLGDLSLQARYLIYKNFVKKWELSSGIGVKLPVGVFDQEQDNVKLPINVQPSSGSYKYFANVFFLKRLNTKLSSYSFASVELADRIISENFNYKYGTLYMLSLGCNHKTFKKFSSGMQVRNEYREKSSREEDIIVDASGGYILYALPSISYSFFDSFYLSSAFCFPIYGYYNDIQRSNKYSVSFKLTKSFNFSKDE